MHNVTIELGPTKPPATIANIYKPSGSRNLSEIPKGETQQIRLGLQGYAGTGKTWAALTFPNPVVVSFDRGLGAHHGREDVIEVPFWDDKFVQRYGSKKKDALSVWLEKEAVRLTGQQTLVVDGLTGIQNAYHDWYSVNKVISVRSGKEDQFAEWSVKKDYLSSICEGFKRLACHIVFISHEADAKDKKTGEYNGKLRPLLTGSFQEEIVSHLTDWFRCWACDKPNIDNLLPETLAKWKMTKDEFRSMLSGYPRNTHYFWQLESNDIFDGKTSSLMQDFPQFLPANYTSFLKWIRKN